MNYIEATDTELPSFDTGGLMDAVRGMQHFVTTNGTAAPFGSFRVEPISGATQYRLASALKIYDRIYSAAWKLTETGGAIAQSMLASLAAGQIIERGKEMLQTDQELDDFQDMLKGFFDVYGRDGITALSRALLPANLPETDPLAWRFLRALGDSRRPATDVTAQEILLHQLRSPLGGRRSAAASALAAFPGEATTMALRELAGRETNKFVSAGVEATLRVLSSYGVSSSQVG